LPLIKNSVEPIISVKKLSKKFGDFIAVNEIDFDVQKGEIFAFLGPNGAGKSTTIKMLTTLMKPTSGELYLAGFDVTKEQDSVRKSFGIVFQDPSLDDELTAYENMMIHAVLYNIPKNERAPKIEELLRLVDLWERKKGRIKTFSGGMKRRLEIARALLHHPQVMFLDEPTLGLDAQTRNMLWNYIRDLNRTKGMTIFFTTHYLGEAEDVAQRIAIIDHGKIIAVGTTEELKEKTGGTTDLEQAYLALTGKEVRDDLQDSATFQKERYKAILKKNPR
jgi:ABC-2 type transport system ATP-binding protein